MVSFFKKMGLGPKKGHNEEDPFINSKMIHPVSDEKKTVPSDEIEYLDVDDYLGYVGRFGKFQILLLLLFCFIIFPSTYQTLVMSFAGNSPSWRCVSQPNTTFSPSGNTTLAPNATTSGTCRVAGDIKVGDDYFDARCKMERSLWKYSKDDDYSIVTQWDLVCDKSSLSYIANSAMFIGWAVGAVVLSWCSDKFGRKRVLYPAWVVLVLSAFLSAFSHALWLFIVFRIIIGFCQGGVGLCLFVMATELVGPKWRSLAGTTVWFAFTLALCVMPIHAMFLKWKTLEIVASIPYIWLAGFYFLTPESIRWLRIQNRIEDAEKELKRVARINKQVVPSNIRLTSPPENGPGKSGGNFMDLFTPMPMAVSTLIQCFSWFVCGQVYYGISLASDQLGGDMYRDFVLTSLVEIPANFLLIYTTNRFGRKPTVVYSFLSSGIACIIVAFIPAKGGAKWGRVALGMLGKLGITVSFNAIYVWSCELYPTVIRTQGMGLMIVLSRFGAASAPWVAQYLTEVHKVLPFTVMGSLGVIAGILCFKLEETNGKPTAETLGEHEGGEGNDVELKSYGLTNGTKDQLGASA